MTELTYVKIVPTTTFCLSVIPSHPPFPTVLIQWAGFLFSKTGKITLFCSFCSSLALIFLMHITFFEVFCSLSTAYFSLLEVISSQYTFQKLYNHTLTVMIRRIS